MKTLQLITFGEQDVHYIEGIKFDSSCIAVMIGDEEDVKKVFNSQYLTMATTKEWQPGEIEDFPRGYILVPPSALIKEKQKETWDRVFQSAFAFRETTIANEEPASSAITALIAYLRYKERLLNRE